MSTLRAAILLCDEVREEYHTEHGRYKDMIQRMFNAIDVAIQFDVFDCRSMDFPNQLDDYDFFITTGSKHSVYEPEEWIAKTVEFIQLLDSKQKKLIGICFGHQLIAKAFGIEVKKSDKGWGLGVAHNQVLNTPQWMRRSQPTLNMIVSHQDQITAIPIKANLIATSEFCPYFVVQWNDHFLSVQGHPEWVSDYSRVRINDRKNILSADTYYNALQSLNTSPDNQLFARWVMDFVEAS